MPVSRVKKNPYTARPSRPAPQPNCALPMRDPCPPYPSSEPTRKPFINPVASPKPRIWTPGSTRGNPPARPSTGPKVSGSVKGNQSNGTQQPLLSVTVKENEGTLKNKKSNQTVTSAVVDHGMSSDSDVNSPKTKRVVKRDSFRGAEISYPVLKSTTNRNSVVENLQVHVDIIGPEANKPPGSSRLKSAGVRRSYSDRAVPRRDASQVSPGSNGNSTLKKSASTKSPKHCFDNENANSTTSPTPHTIDDEWEDERELHNIDTDAEDLLSSINKSLASDNTYKNLVDPVEEVPPPLPSRDLKYKDKKLNQSTVRPNTPERQPMNSSPIAIRSKRETQSSQGSSNTKPIPPKSNKFVKSVSLDKPSTNDKSSSPSVSFSKSTDNGKNGLNSSSKTSNLPSSNLQSSKTQPSKTIPEKAPVPVLPQKPVLKTLSENSNRSTSNFSPKSNVKGSAVKPETAFAPKKNAPHIPPTTKDTRNTHPSSANVSSIKAKFNQNADASTPLAASTAPKDKPVIKRAATVAGTKPSVADKPSVKISTGTTETKTQKPIPGPKPRDPSFKPAPPKPKRVQSFKI